MPALASNMDDLESDKKSLEKFSSMVRLKLSKFMQIRRVPKLIFKYDESLERYNNIDALLNSLSD